jgi:DNA-binding transcriptional MerR regulator
MKLTIEELADKVNEILSKQFDGNLLRDGRQSSVISTRRIRDYITKGLLEKPEGNGREKWFVQSHIDALVSLRLLQHNGLSDQYIISSTQIEPGNDTSYSTDSPLISSSLNNEDKELRVGALDFLKSIGGQPVESKLNAPTENEYSAKMKMMVATPKFSSSSHSLTYPKSAIEEDLERLKLLNQQKFRQFNEYVVDEGLGVFLKVDSKVEGELQKKLFAAIKQEIKNHIKGEKND